MDPGLMCDRDMCLPKSEGSPGHPLKGVESWILIVGDGLNPDTYISGRYVLRRGIRKEKYRFSNCFLGRGSASQGLRNGFIIYVLAQASRKGREEKKIVVFLHARKPKQTSSPFLNQRRGSDSIFKTSRGRNLSCRESSEEAFAEGI